MQLFCSGSSNPFLKPKWHFWPTREPKIWRRNYIALMNGRIYISEVVFFIFFHVNRPAFIAVNHITWVTAVGSALQAKCRSHVLDIFQKSEQTGVCKGVIFFSSGIRLWLSLTVIEIISVCLNDNNSSSPPDFVIYKLECLHSCSKSQWKCLKLNSVLCSFPLHSCISHTYSPPPQWKAYGWPVKC